MKKSIYILGLFAVVSVTNIVTAFAAEETLRSLLLQQPWY